MGPTITPYPVIPGGYSVSGETAHDLKYIYLAKQEAFTINIYGLMPLTRHYVFFEGVKVPASKIKPRNNALGADVYTDINGQAEFVFYYQSDVIASTSSERYIEIGQRIGGDKEIVVASTPEGVGELSATFRSLYSSYGTSTIFFKTTPMSELPIKSSYSFAYPSQASVDDSDDAGGYNRNNYGEDESRSTE